MIIDKKGLSAVVTTLILILLVLVAVGIIWVVIRAVVETGTGTIDYTAKCLRVDLRATVVNNTAGTNYDVTLKRESGGDDINGVKIVFSNDTDSSSVIDSLGNIETLATVTRNVNGEISNANKVEVTPYFLDDAGEEHLCGGQTNTFVF